MSIAVIIDSKNYEYVIMQVNKRCANFSLKMHQKRSARPGPAGGAYSVPPDPLAACMDLRGRGKGKEKGTDRRKGEQGREVQGSSSGPPTASAFWTH